MADYNESRSSPMGIYLLRSGLRDGRRDYAVRLRPKRPRSLDTWRSLFLIFSHVRGPKSWFQRMLWQARTRRARSSLTDGTGSMETIALLLASLLFGGMTLYSFGFAAFVFSALPPELSGNVIRQAFPHFYVFVIATSGVAATLLCFLDTIAAVVMGMIAVTTIPARQVLMPAINLASDHGAKKKFKFLHSLSVLITVSQIIGSGYILATFIQE